MYVVWCVLVLSFGGGGEGGMGRDVVVENQRQQAKISRKENEGQNQCFVLYTVDPKHFQKSDEKEEQASK